MSALDSLKKIKRRKVSHIRELSDDGVFRLAPIEEKPRRLIELQDREIVGVGRKSYYREVNIAGKKYLIKKVP